MTTDPSLSVLKLRYAHAADQYEFIKKISGAVSAVNLDIVAVQVLSSRPGEIQKKLENACTHNLETCIRELSILVHF